MNTFVVERGSDGERIADNLSRNEARKFLALILRKLRQSGAAVKRIACQDGFADYQYVLIRENETETDSVSYFDKYPTVSD